MEGVAGLMFRSPYAILLLILALVVAILLIVTNVIKVNAAAAASLCVSGSNVTTIGNYHLQANEFNSGAPFTACSDGKPDFTVTQSGINVATNGAPGGYPSVYAGCHWGYCTNGNPFPIPVSDVEGTGMVTTTDHTTVAETGAWDDSYDIWFNYNQSSAPASNSNPPSLEMMIWLDHAGGVSPAGRKVAWMMLDGIPFDVWSNATGTGGTISYVAQYPVDSVTNLDLAPFAQDAVARGIMSPAWQLFDVEAGFEIWQGGQGLAQTAFSVNVGSPPAPVLCCGRVVSVSPTRATVAWDQTVSRTDNVEIIGPGPINGHTGSTTNDEAVYSGLESGHTYTVYIQPTVDGGIEGQPGHITFRTP